jgi:hypothetical protein
MAKKRFLWVMLATVLVFGMLIVGCDDGSTGGGGSDGETPETVKVLPNFDGTFVESEQEATTLATMSQSAVSTAISAAVASGAKSNIQGRAVVNNAHYEYNGVSLDYTVSYSDNYPTPPYTSSIVEYAIFNGTYSGYKIDGKMDIKISQSYTSASDYNIKYTYNCIYTVSKDGKGMKLVYTGDMDMSSTGKYVYNLHFSIYDNNNVRKYDYNYDYKL